MNTQGTLPLLFRLGLRKDFRDKWVEYSPNYSQFLKTSTTDRPEFEAAVITGPSRMLELGDAAIVDYDDLVMSDKILGVDKEFGRGFIVSQRTIEDDQYGKARSGAQWLAHAARMTMEYRGASFLDDAFTGTYFKSFDNVAWISTSHTFLNSAGNWANRPAVEVGLSVTGVTSLFDLATKQKDHNGDPYVTNPNKLVIGNDAGEQNRAIQIFKSMSEPFTTENQDNAIQKRWGNTQIVPAIYKSSTTSYFLIDDKYNDANFIVRRNPTVDDWIDKETRATKFASTMRFMIIGVDARGWYGANPT